MIGKAFALAALSVTSAAVVSPVNVQQATLIASMFGGVLLALSTASSVIFAPTPPTDRQKMRVLFDMVCSIVGGGIGGWFVAPAVCLYLNQTHIEVVSFLGLCIGMMFWKFAPTMISLLTWIAEMRARALGAKT